MFSDPQLFLFWLVVVVAGYWLLPARHSSVRAIYLVASSFYLVFSLAPYAALLVVYITLAAWGWAWAFNSWRSKLTFWLAVLSVLGPLLVFRSILVDLDSIFTLGIAFSSLKSVSVIIESYQSPGRRDLSSIFLLNFFFPIYSAGPVERPATFAIEKMGQSFSIQFILDGFIRICLGLFKSLFVAEVIFMGLIKAEFPGIASNPSDYPTWCLYVYLLTRFMYTYANFSGYTDIAIGAGRMFGFDIMENFNFPIFARNLQDFWRRWHISLGGWVIRNLFFPLVAIIRHPAGLFVASISSFMLLGLWHERTLNFCMWGLFHGLGLAVVQYIQKRWGKSERYKSLSKHPLYVFSAWLFTLVYVSWLQTLGNMPTFAAGLKLTLGLFGI